MKKLLLTLILSIFSLTSFAGYDSPVFKDQYNNAINGYDPVAYFKKREAEKGKEKYKFRYMGAEWHFESKENLEAFKADPKKYAPQYGGYCAYAVTKGQKARVNPKAFDIYNGKLYLNYSKGILRRWQSDRVRNIGIANQNWVKIK